MKYCVVSIAMLALLISVDGHIHNHRELSRRALRQDPTKGHCPTKTLTTTMIIHVDEAGQTIDQQSQFTRKPESVIVSSPILETSAKSSLIAQAPAHSPSQQSLQADRHIIPVPPALTSLPDSAGSNYIPDDIEDLLGSRNDYGIAYSPYKADSTCKNQDEVSDDIRQLRRFSYVRFYGIDCNQAETVTRAARESNMMAFAGLYDIDNIEADLQKIIDAAGDDWSTFHTVSIGNELVNRGSKSPAEVVGTMSLARTILRQAGYQGPVVTVDTASQMLAHPELCDESDYCAANCHAFFDATVTPENAGPYVLEQAHRISKATRDGNKRVIITESGWPTAGQPNGKAVPSLENQMVAIKSLHRSFSGEGIVFFSAFDDKWKQDNAWTFGTEKHWGIKGLTTYADFLSDSIGNPGNYDT